MERVKTFFVKFTRYKNGEIDWTQIIGILLWSVALVFLGVGISGCAGWGNSQYVTNIKINQGNGGDGGGGGPAGNGSGGNVAALDMKTSLDNEQASAFGLGDGSQTPIGSLLNRVNPQVIKPVDNSVEDNRIDNSIRYDGDKPVPGENVEDQVDSGNDIIPGPGDPDPVPDPSYNTVKQYESYGVRNGRQAWRIEGKGPSFGDKIKFVFQSGAEFTVNNTSKNCRDDEATCDRNSKADDYGFVFKPGIGPNGEGDSDTGTAHGGIYLHAPHGDKSKWVKMYYNVDKKPVVKYFKM